MLIKNFHRTAITMLASALVCLGCGTNIGGSASNGPPAAKVDGVAISQASLPQAAALNSQEERKALLDAAIMEQLLANAAARQNLTAPSTDNSEAARRHALAEVYIGAKAAHVPRVSPQEVASFYERHPELFSARRVYRLQEIAIITEPSKADRIQKAFIPLKTFAAREAWLKANQIDYRVNVMIKPADELPGNLASMLAIQKDGTAFEVPNPQGISTVQITGIKDKPLTLEQSKASIEKFLINQRARDLIEMEIKRLQANAKVEYFPPYAKKFD